MGRDSDKQGHQGHDQKLHKNDQKHHLKLPTHKKLSKTPNKYQRLQINVLEVVRDSDKQGYQGHDQKLHKKTTKTSLETTKTSHTTNDKDYK